MMHYLLDDLKKEATPLTYDHTPLKYSMKSDNIKMVELLITRGGYY